MALELKGLAQISQDGKYLWFTENRGEYAVTTNEEGWGTPNVELNQSALLSWVYRMENPTAKLEPVGQALRFNVGATNADENQFQTDYLADGYHQFHIARLMVSADDTNSIDTTPVVFTVGDVWFNSIDTTVKQLQAGGVVALDITDQDDLALIVASTSIIYLLCETMYYKDLSIHKNELYTSYRAARRNEDTAQIKKLRIDMTDIMLGTATAAYQFSYGLKLEAQDTIESLLDDFNLN